MENQPKLYPRTLFLTDRLAGDYMDMARQYSSPEKMELTEHLLQIFRLALMYYETENEVIRHQIHTIEDNLIAGYRKRLTAYKAKHFEDYLYVETASTIRMPDEEPQMEVIQTEQVYFIVDAHREFLRFAISMFQGVKDKLYLEMDEPINIDAPPAGIASVDMGEDGQDKSVTKARQLLAIYYFLKDAYGIEARGTHDASSVARLIHLLTGTKYTTLQKSEIYKKFLRMPNYKTDAKLIEDLDFIRPYFSDLGLHDAIKLINEERGRAIDELPLSERKKYRKGG